MTTTDQAFIRVYGQTSDRGPHSEMSEAPTRTAAVTDNRAEADRWESSPARSWRYDQAATKNVDASRRLTSVIAAPLSDILTGLCSDPVDRPKPAGPPAPPSDDAPPASNLPDSPSAKPRRPLSSFQAITASAVEPQRPGMTVSAPKWPTIFAEAVRHYRGEFDRVAHVVLNASDDGRSLIAVTGSQAGQGITTTLLCLARQLAARGKSVAVVEANFANPQLAAMFDLQPDTSWQDVLCRGVPVANALIESRDDRITLLPAFGQPEMTCDRTLGLQASITAGVVRFGYDVTLVDLGPLHDSQGLLPVPQFLIPTMRIDAALLVTDSQQSDRHTLQEAANCLAAAACEPLGIVENFAPITH